MEEQEIIIKKNNDFELKDIFECGQCFRWNKNDDDSYTGVIKNGVLNVKINGENIIFKGILNENIKDIVTDYFDLNRNYEKIKEKLYTRDYFSMTTYFRLFISNLYPQYNKAIYLDCDIVLLKDIAELYNIDIGDNLLGAVPDDIIQKNEVFQEYVEKVVGVANYKTYFNAGMLVMNLDELRKFQFQEKFLYLLENIKFSVIQDQDYLNRICKGRVKLIDTGWNLMPTASDDMKEEDIKLIHYNYQYKRLFSLVYQTKDLKLCATWILFVISYPILCFIFHSLHIDQILVRLYD